MLVSTIKKHNTQILIEFMCVLPLVLKSTSVLSLFNILPFLLKLRWFPEFLIGVLCEDCLLMMTAVYISIKKLCNRFSTSFVDKGHLITAQQKCLYQITKINQQLPYRKRRNGQRRQL